MTAPRLVPSLEGDRQTYRQTTVIDENHLGRMTLGDRRLEREVLELFLRQTTIMLNRVIGAEPPLAAAAAHTLKGSARGIGAWRVARAAELLEQAANGDAGKNGPGVDAHTVWPKQPQSSRRQASRPARQLARADYAIGRTRPRTLIAIGFPALSVRF